MATLFVTRPGQVVAFQEVGSLPLSVFLENWPGFPQIRAIITQISYNSSGNFQFLHSLREFIYVYVFGERLGTCVIGGLAFSEACAVSGGLSGPEQLTQYYDQFRLSKYGQPLTAQIGLSGRFRVRGFLTNYRMDIFDTQNQIGQFSLQLNTLPREALRQ